ncbi:MAG: molybdenum ABC transporter ATP-binding protein [Nitrospina sp.]|jgi:molybdate transport system ATP-binding protein|nr:molybdenum ABC transporter ATP-binding protein [Nitrospina sp.]MBT6717167.1 molybdenum ABC transporter ATP-binding protein [Nitrospina sp.]
MTEFLKAAFKVDYPGFNLDVDLKLPASGITVVFGPSGSGKTTLLRCLAGLEKSGRMEIAGKVWQDENVFIPVNKRAIGMVFQEARLFPHLNVRENLLYGYKRTPLGLRKLHLEEVVRVLALENLLQRGIEKLSGGEKQRVALGRALLTSPQILLMDEPLAALDTQRKTEIIPFIRKIEKELSIPIIYVTHSMSEVLQLVDTMVILKNGKVVDCGPVEKVFSDIHLRDAIGDQHSGAVLDTTVLEHDTEFGITRLDFMGQELSVPIQNINPGQELRVHIHSKDVSLATQPPEGLTSVLNILKTKVKKIGKNVGYSVDIELDAGRPLLATITRKSLSNLNLQPGQSIFAFIKAIRMVHDSENI